MRPLPDSLAIDAAARRVRLDPRDPTFFRDPYPAYSAIRTACPVFLWEDYGFPCCAGFAEVDALFRDRRFGREVPATQGGEARGRPPRPDHVAPFYALDSLSMLEREPPAHTRLRGLLGRAFVSRAVERLRPRIAALAHALAEHLPRGRPFDLLAAFAEPIPVRIIADLLGLPASDEPHLLAWSHSMVAMYRLDRTREVEDAAVAATLAFSAHLAAALAARREQPRADLLTLLAQAGEAQISEDEAVANAVLLLNAGHEATVHALGNAVAAILGAGLAPTTLFATDEGTNAVVEEALRFDPPLHLFTRFALEPCAIGGFRLEVGDPVGLLIGAANRDPAAFPDPDRFDARRATAPHAAFGAGIHFCLGAPLARLELQVALPILFAQMPDLHLVEPPRSADRYHFRGFETVMVSTRG